MSEQTTTETTVLPTPAKDRMKAERANAEKVEQDFTVRETASLNAMSRDEVASQAADFPYIEVKTSTSKKSLVTQIVSARWHKTEAYKAFKALESASDAETLLLKQIASAGNLTFWKDRLREAIEDDGWYSTDRVIDAAADLRKATVIADMWRRVTHLVTEYDKEPLEAVRLMVADALKDAVSSRHNRALSRSSSVVANLTTDIDNEAVAEWIREAVRYVPGNVEIETNRFGW